MVSAKNTDSTPPPSNEILFRIIKIIDIAYIAILYFVFDYFPGYYLNSFFEYAYGTNYATKSNNELIGEVLVQVICISIISYIGRNVVQMVPFPLDGINGFVHSRVKELASGAFFTVFIIMFQYSMQDKLVYIKNSTKKTTI